MAPTAEIAGRYQVGRKLGSGGMSTVYLGMDRVLERSVALKLLADHLAEDGDFVARFRREALAAARLTHPNIVQVFDSGQDRDSGQHYIVMEFVDGDSCADLLRDQKRLDVDRAVELTRDACHGLAYAHRAGVIHRDVKPGNLLVARDSGATKLADFGIAKAAEQTRITQVGSVLGTAAYLSPEQARGEEAGPPSDIYSLGVCAYQFLTGRLPHEYTSLTELALKQQEDDVDPITLFRPEVPPQLDRAIRLCLERHPVNRYSSALEFAQALGAGLSGEETETTRQLTATGGLTDDQTRALGQVTGATRAMRQRRTPPMTPVSPPDQAKPSKPKGSGRGKRFLMVFGLLVVLAAVAVGLFYFLSDGGPTGDRVPSVDRGSVEQQVQGIEQFLRDNTRGGN